MSAFGPLEIERWCLLFLSFTFAVVGLSVGLNALVRANQERSYVIQLVLFRGIIDIDVDIHDVFTSGAVITAICAILAVLAGVFCAFMRYPFQHGVFSFRIQSWILFFCAACLVVVLVTYDYFFASRSAQITINLHGLPVPEPVIQRLEDLLDFAHPYRDIYFLRLLGVLPWFAFISAVAAGVVLRLAAHRVDASASKTEQEDKRDRVGLQTWA